jgi:tight adherence protein B
MWLTELLSYGLVMSSAGLAVGALYPALARAWTRATDVFVRYQEFMSDKSSRILDDIFVNVDSKLLKVAYGVTPLVFGALGLVVSRNLIIGLVGLGVGMVLPELAVRQVGVLRKLRFQSQLVDALFMLSSSLKAGLSLTQSFEVLEAEMSPPASQEFGLVVRAHKVGRTFEEAIQQLNRRMACEEMNLMTTAILVGRETGGDVTHIISQLVGTIREKKKLKDKVKTLTLQGRLQAYIMSALPVFFFVWVRSMNPGYFELMFTDPLGRTALAVAVGLWVTGMLLLMHFSKVEI